MASGFEHVVETVAVALPAVVVALLACRWWMLRRTQRRAPPAVAANDDARPDVRPEHAEPQWPASFEITETCRRINRNMAESAFKARRGRTVIVELGHPLRRDELVRTLREADDAAAWRVLEPITVTGEVIALIESVRKHNGESSAQSLRLCIERLWGQRVARDTAEHGQASQGRHGDTGPGGPPPA